ANVAFETGIGDRPVLAVPDSAVIDSGTGQVVLIERGGGKFEPREVKLGARADGLYEVRQGLAAGERVVVSANFLIDAESNLRAAGHRLHGVSRTSAASRRRPGHLSADDGAFSRAAFQGRPRFLVLRRLICLCRLR